ncbi:uncharacterized protein LOC124913335 [Impatiens glandulifera]|uniref:uncharacterized protein LOC124913335 n=1 Tax=Impatiens glandulifera TaxID=253017 RepID=UPI001FB0A8AE|nr:uncharacterized protein LOC124913335 [Impatiens glandulifera]
MLLMSFAAAKEERGSSVTWLTKLLSLMGGCLGCWESTTHPNGDGILVRKPSASEGFWSTSNYDLDNNGLLSQRSMSFLILPNLNEPSEFVNHGLLLWNQTRLQWVGSKKSENREKNRNPTISWNATYDTLLGSNKRFARSIPLSEMVEFLEDVWEEECLYE